MDTLAHGLWGGMLAGWKRRFWPAFLFGMGPDLGSFGAWIGLRLLQGNFRMQGPPRPEMIPQWVYNNYDITHSLLITGAVWLALWRWKRDLAIPFLAWPIHILFDIPTHSVEFFPTPFLYPVSDFVVDGFSWGQRWFMIANYTALGVTGFLFLSNRLRQRRNRHRVELLEEQGK